MASSTVDDELVRNMIMSTCERDVLASENHAVNVLVLTDSVELSILLVMSPGKVLSQHKYALPLPINRACT